MRGQGALPEEVKFELRFEERIEKSKLGDRQHLGIFDNVWRFFDCHNSGIAPGIQWVEVRLLLSILHCTALPPQQGLIPPKMSVILRLRNPALGREELVLLVCVKTYLFNRGYLILASSY